MSVFHPDPLALRLGNLLVNLVGQVTRFILHHVAKINLVAENGFDCGWRPEITVLTDIGLVPPHVVEDCGRWYIFCVQRGGDFAVAVPLAA